MALLDHTNYTISLKESSTGRYDTPTGNVYFDVSSNEIQLIGVNELAEVNFGSGNETNPLNNPDGITLRGLYNFENSRRKVNEELRKYLRGTDGSYRFAGAFNFVNGIKLDEEKNENVIRGKTGFISTDDSPVKVMVIPTNEELVIAMDTERIIKESKK